MSDYIDMNIPAEQIVGNGKNIKCHDKIKLTHVATNNRIHANNFECKGGSFNTAVTCHKARDDSDWFVAITIEQRSLTYHFRYNDTIALVNSEKKKFLHLTPNIESQVSKHMQISLCEQDIEKMPQIQDQWIVQVAEGAQDQYWRVGEVIRLKNKNTSAYLCSHRRKIKQNDDCEVYGEKLQASNSKKQSKGAIRSEASLWIVSQIAPFIYTASISDNKSPKMTEQLQQLKKLNESKNSLIKAQPKKVNVTDQILKMQNRRFEQIANEKLKLEQQNKKGACWRKYLCCCCYDNSGYQKLDL